MCDPSQEEVRLRQEVETAQSQTELDEAFVKCVEFAEAASHKEQCAIISRFISLYWERHSVLDAAT
jgi:hypothetical protein